MWENTTPSTELPRDFYAGIGPLQLGVVLVFIIIKEPMSVQIPKHKYLFSNVDMPLSLSIKSSVSLHCMH